jgi:hypothetical protein
LEKQKDGSAVTHADDLASSPGFPVPEGMEVHFTPELEAKLTQSAAQKGRDPDELVQDVIEQYF